MAIASGISDGLGLGSNARAAMTTRVACRNEEAWPAMGANERLFPDIAVWWILGADMHKRNLKNHCTTGVKLCSGIKLADILSHRQGRLQGVDTAESAIRSTFKNIMLRCLLWSRYKVLYEDKSSAEASQ